MSPTTLQDNATKLLKTRLTLITTNIAYPELLTNKDKSQKRKKNEVNLERVHIRYGGSVEEQERITLNQQRHNSSSIHVKKIKISSFFVV